ncbi:MAG TPA: hypothetical protein VGT24_03915 [Candidatus Acidoferrales bacterium]|nr:hypothetical protein [Candidatus Acidoferrales bacterium]
MARTRKLFPIYASALANNMLAALVHDRVVVRFVAAYVASHDRRAILGGPARDRELAGTIGREILLALVAETRGALPRFFGKQLASKLKPEEQEAIEAFFHELLAALARAENWSPEDRRQFRRDLELYSEFCRRREVPARNRKPETAKDEESPFIARVALLLDPSMMEQARRATREFHGSVGQLARTLLRRTLG